MKSQFTKLHKYCQQKYYLGCYTVEVINQLLKSSVGLLVAALVQLFFFFWHAVHPDITVCYSYYFFSSRFYF